MPRNVEVVVQTATSITLSWEAPLDLGGRDENELHYQLCYEQAEVLSCMDLGTSTTGIIAGR